MASGTRIQSRANTITANDTIGAPETTRTRQTQAPARPFQSFIQYGSRALLTGAEVAAGAVGGPALAATVHGVAEGVAASAGGGTSVGGGGAAAGDDLSTMYAMQRESQALNIQLLELQEAVQDENRRFSALTNVLRAKHDTAKAAISNIRS